MSRGFRIPRALWDERLHTAAALVLALGFAWFEHVRLIEHGFVSVSADEFSRSIRSQKWAADPSILWWTGTWMPLERYLNGAAYLLVGDALQATRLTAFVFACLLLVYLVLLTRLMFERIWVTAIAAIALAAHPWYVWLGATPMLDIYFLAPFVGGVYVVCRSLKKERNTGLWLAGLHFIVASAFHVSAWLLINLVNALLLGRLMRLIKSRHTGKALGLCAFFLLNNAYIIYYLAATWVIQGHPLAAFSEHTSYSKWRYDGYAVSVLSKLSHYPVLLYKKTHILFIAVGAATALLVSISRQPYHRKLVAFLAAAGLVAVSLFNLFSVPATAAPGRYCLPYVVLLCPYFGYGAYQLMSGPVKKIGLLDSKPAAVLRAAAGIAVIAAVLASSFSHLYKYRGSLGRDSVDVGRFLREQIQARGSECNDHILLQRVYWQYKAVIASAGHEECFVFDRPGDARHRNEPSVLASFQAFSRFMAQNDIHYIVVWEDLHERFLTRLAEARGGWRKRIGRWSVYKIRS